MRAGTRSWTTWGLTLLALVAGVGTVLLAEGQPWGRTATGEGVELFTLRNAKGLEARITTFGGTLVALRTPDREGRLDEVTAELLDAARALRRYPAARGRGRGREAWRAGA